jgi:hypothetical protein
MGDHERSKSLTRYPNTDTVPQCMFLGSNVLYRPFVFFRSCLSIDDYTDQRGHAVTMNKTIQGCRPRPLELELHILFCLSCTMTKTHLNRESSEHMQDAGELMIIIITIFINCNWVITRWQWLFYIYTNMNRK